MATSNIAEKVVIITGASSGIGERTARLLAGQGAKLFVQRGCPACHVLDATSKAKMVGPNLANIGSRRYIGAGIALNNDENLARWIQNPHDMKVGVTMPNMGLTSEQARAVAAFLRTLK